MRIAIFIHSLEGGGAERVVTHLANAWAGMGREVTVITLTGIESDAYPLHPSVSRIGLDLVTVSMDLSGAVLANVERVFALRQILKKLKPDVVVAMMMTASILAVLASIGLKCRTIISERCYPPAVPVGRFWSILRRLVYPWADMVVAQTQQTSGWLRNYAGCKRIVVIPNPVVLPLTQAAPVLNPDEIIKPDRHLLLAVGRLSDEKGFDLLLDAFSRVSPVCPEWDLVILGEGPLRTQLFQQARALGLTSHVSIPGRAGNMADWYKRADLFVLSSRGEGFPNVLIEAMALGCAVVSYDCYAGPRDIISHEVNGLLVKPSDVDALAASLISLMSNEERRLLIAKNALAVQETFSISHVLLLWEKIMNPELI